MDSVKASLSALEMDYSLVASNLLRMRTALYTIQSELMSSGSDRTPITLQNKDQASTFASILSSPLRVAAYGPKGSGKCSLLNFFVGARLFPNAEGVKRTRIIESYHSTPDEARLEVWTLDDLLRAKTEGLLLSNPLEAESSSISKIQIPSPTFQLSLAGVTRGKVFKEIEPYILKPDSEMHNDKWHQMIVRVYWPIEIGTSVSYVYLPGSIDGATGGMEEHISIYLTNTVLAGVIFCYDNATFSDSEVRCHDRLLRLLSAIEPSLKPAIFYLCTKFDAKSISPDRGSDAGLTKEDVEREMDRCLDYLSSHMGIASELEFTQSSIECPYWAACSANDYKQLAIMSATSPSSQIKLWIHTVFTEKFVRWLFTRIASTRHRTLLLQVSPVRTWFYYLLKKISALSDTEWSNFKSQGEYEIAELRQEMERQFQQVLIEVKRVVQNSFANPELISKAKNAAKEILIHDPLTAEQTFHTAFSKFLIEHIWRHPLSNAHTSFNHLLQDIIENAKRTNRASNLLLFIALQSASTASEGDFLPKPALRSHWWIVSQSFTVIQALVKGKVDDEWKVKKAESILQDPNLSATFKQVDKAVSHTLDSYFHPVKDTLRGRAQVGDEARTYFRTHNTTTLETDFQLLDINMWRAYAYLNKVSLQQTMVLPPPSRCNPHLQRTVINGINVLIQSFSSRKDKSYVLSDELSTALLYHTIVGSGDVAGSVLQLLGLNCHVLSSVPRGLPSFGPMREICEQVPDFQPFLVFLDVPTIAEWKEDVSNPFTMSLEDATASMVSLARLIIVTYSMELVTPEFQPTSVFVITKDGFPKNVVWLPSGVVLAPAIAGVDAKQQRKVALERSLDSLCSIAQSVAAMCTPEDAGSLCVKWPRLSYLDLCSRLSVMS
jgi:hypothetical protein